MEQRLREDSGDAVVRVGLTERRLATFRGHKNTKCVFTLQLQNRQQPCSEPDSCFINLLTTKTHSLERPGRSSVHPSEPPLTFDLSHTEESFVNGLLA